MDRWATKTRTEREDEETERLSRPAPKLKPPRHDRRRNEVSPDDDPDEPEKDKDLSLNYKDVGGSTGGRVFTYDPMDSMGNRTSVYHGIEPDPPAAYPGWNQPDKSEVGESDFALILDQAKEELDPLPHWDSSLDDQRLREALDYAVKKLGYHRYILPITYDWLLKRLAEDTGLVASGIQYGDWSEEKEEHAMRKLSAQQSKTTSQVLERLDKTAAYIQENHEKLGWSFETAKTAVNLLDEAADAIELGAFGVESLERRREEVMAKVHQRDADEPYMDTFNGPLDPHKTDADEPYMEAYDDDQSEAVDSGSESTGEPLVP